MRKSSKEIPAALAVLPLWLLIPLLRWGLPPEYINAGDEAFRRLTAGAVGGVLALGFLSFLGNLQLSRLFVGLLFIFVFLRGGLVRVGVRRGLTRLTSKHRTFEVLCGCPRLGTVCTYGTSSDHATPPS